MAVRMGIVCFLVVMVSVSAWGSSLEEKSETPQPGDLLEIISEGYRLYGEGKLAEAESLFQVVLEQDPLLPERGELRLLLAGIREHEMDLSGAVAHYRLLSIYDPASYRDGEYYSYRDYALLRIEYLTSEPTWTRPEREVLLRELTSALTDHDRARCETLAKKGDFWFGWMYSEKTLSDRQSSLEYLFRYLLEAQVGQWEEIWEDQWAIPLYPWNDPETSYDLLYCTVSQGVFGWEWDGLILSWDEWRNSPF